MWQLKIVVFEVEEWERRAFEGLEAEYEIEFVEAPLSQDNVKTYAATDSICPFIYSNLFAGYQPQAGGGS